jgi:hypothetical protein
MEGTSIFINDFGAYITKQIVKQQEFNTVCVGGGGGGGS